VKFFLHLIIQAVSPGTEFDKLKKEIAKLPTAGSNPELPIKNKKFIMI